jgi:hypothetical protein
LLLLLLLLLPLLLLLLPDIGLGEQRVEFPADVDPTSLHGKVRTSCISSLYHSSCLTECPTAADCSSAGRRVCLVLCGIGISTCLASSRGCCKLAMQPVAWRGNTQ